MIKRTHARRKIAITLLTATLVIVGCTSGPSPYDNIPSRLTLPERLTIISDMTCGDKKGLVDIRGNVILEANYRSIHGPFNGSSPLVPVNDWGDNRWGFVNHDGVWVFPPMYRQVTNFVEGFACGVKRDGTIDILSFDGRVVETIAGDECGEFGDDLIPVRRGSNWGVVDPGGEIVVPFDYQYIQAFRHGYAAAVTDGYFGIIDTDGQSVIPHIYSSAHVISADRFYVFDGPLVVVFRGDDDRTRWDYDVSGNKKRFWRVIDTDGETIFDEDTVLEQFFDDNADYRIGIHNPFVDFGRTHGAIVVGTMERRIAIDQDGKPLFPNVFAEIVFDDNGGYFVDIDDPLRLHIFDANFNVTRVVDMPDPFLDYQGSERDHYFQYSAGGIVVSPDPRARDTSGKHLRPQVVTIPDGDLLEQFDGTFIPVDIKKGFYTYYDWDPFGHPGAPPCSVSLSDIRIIDPDERVSYHRRYPNRGEIVENGAEPIVESFLLDKTDDSEVALTEEIVHVGPFINGVAIFRTKAGYGTMDRNGTVLIEPAFEEMGQFVNGLTPALENDKWGYIDRTGEWIIPPRFHAALPFVQSYAPVWNGETWGYIDRIGELVIDYQFAFAEPFLDGYAIVASNLRGMRGPVEYEDGIRDSLTLFIDGPWTIITRTGVNVEQPIGERIWRLDSRRVLVLDSGQYKVHYVFEGRGRPIDDEEAEELIWGMHRLYQR